MLPQPLYQPAELRPAYQLRETRSGRYWYNLHLVLVISAHYRIGEAATLAKIRDTTLRICVKKGYAASVLSVLPDHWDRSPKWSQFRSGSGQRRRWADRVR